MSNRNILLIVMGCICFGGLGSAVADEPKLRLTYEPGWLVIQGEHLPGGELRIHYLEAYCRANSSDADWVQQTVVGHTTELLEANQDRTRVKLRDRLADGVIVEHTITAAEDEVDFRLEAYNPTEQRSDAHWAQPCVRLAEFTGFDPQGSDIEDYLPKCFIFLDGQLSRLPTENWSTTARYTPGQVWCPRGVPRTDVNPRPLSKQVPSLGLIGAFSRDDSLIFATAWEPYQELFQGVARCLHSDFRLGGLLPGAKLSVRGKIYLLPPDVPELLRRYERDFPEHGLGNQQELKPKNR